MVLKCMKVSSSDQIPIHKNRYFVIKVVGLLNYYLDLFHENVYNLTPFVNLLVILLSFFSHMKSISLSVPCLQVSNQQTLNTYLLFNKKKYIYIFYLLLNLTFTKPGIVLVDCWYTVYHVTTKGLLHTLKSNLHKTKNIINDSHDLLILNYLLFLLKVNIYKTIYYFPLKFNFFKTKYYFPVKFYLFKTRSSTYKLHMCYS